MLSNLSKRSIQRLSAGSRLVNNSNRHCIAFQLKATTTQSCDFGIHSWQSHRCLSGMKVYTKTGDKGTSQLFSGERRNKDDVVFQAIGAVDECNAMIGVACEYVDDAGVKEFLEFTMSRMFDVGASVATPSDNSPNSKLRRTAFHSHHVTGLEKEIDRMDLELEPMKHFILPGGGKCSAHLHVARTLARKAERRVVPLVRNGSADPQVGIYLNRLSDYLFVCSRYMSLKQGNKEKPWIKSVDPEN